MGISTGDFPLPVGNSTGDFSLHTGDFSLQTGNFSLHPGDVIDNVIDYLMTSLITW
jgi:hypothetical protein